MKGGGKKEIIFTPSLSPKPKLGQNLMLSICMRSAAAFRAVNTGETTHSAQKCHQSQCSKTPWVSFPSREGDACNHLHTWTRPPRYSLALDCLWRPWLVSPLLSVDLLLVSVSERGHTQQTLQVDVVGLQMEEGRNLRKTYRYIHVGRRGAAGAHHVWKSKRTAQSWKEVIKYGQDNKINNQV